MSARVIYAIGDVHGEATRYGELLAEIQDRHKILFPNMAMCIVQVGDLIDRGPDSYATVQAAMDLEAKYNKGDVVHLLGNHEQMMLDGLQDVDGSDYAFWQSNGGVETLTSYRRAGYRSVPKSHLDWLRARPVLYADATQKLIFVHAGIDVKAYPNCRREVRLWTRSPRFFHTDGWRNKRLEGWTVVHGHTPTDNYLPEVDGQDKQRINVDTGVVYGGRLTAAIFAPGEDVQFCYA